jgi:hypothetical protein
LTTGSFPHDNFSSVYWILTNMATWFPCGRGRTLFILGSKFKVTITINIILDNRIVFCTITLVLYIRSLPNLATWFPCGRGRTLFILVSLPLYRLIIYTDRHILWCTHFLFSYIMARTSWFFFSFMSVLVII